MPLSLQMGSTDAISPERKAFMGKLVVLKLGEGSFEQGFAVTLQIGPEGERPSTEINGKLPPAPGIHQQYSCWQQTYLRLGLPSRLEAPAAQLTNVSHIDDCRQTAQLLSNSLNCWLRAESFRSIRETLLEKLTPAEEIRILVQTEAILVQRLPWHLWDLLGRYPKAEISLSAPEYQLNTSIKTPTYRDKVRILAILGNSEGIDVATDRQLLQNLPNATTTFLVEPQRQELNDQLWEQTWDIIFFAGHSKTDDKKGLIYINQTKSITIEELKFALRKSIGSGLQLAIFNSCDGLGLAHDLESLHIPQLIVMREPVPDEVAQEFLKHFLKAFAGIHHSQAMPLHLSVREAREKLQGLEDDFPCASFLPVICQQASVPPLWEDLGRRPTQMCPYRGLFAFREEDTEFFFGRETFTEQLLSSVRKQPLVAVIGPSGSGKSSAVFAGLIPRLRAGGKELAPLKNIISFRPGNHPCRNLALQLVPLLENNVGEIEQLLAVNQLSSVLKLGELSLKDVLLRIQEKNLDPRLLIAVDQFEELYTLCRDESERQLCLDGLLEVIKELTHVNVILTLRADFLGYALSHRPLADALQVMGATCFLGPMNREELQSAIVSPAEKLGVTIEEGLTNTILNDIEGQPGNLPLLEFALTQLWAKQSNGSLTYQVYEEIGGVERALANHAEAVYGSLLEADKQRAQRVFIQLVNPGEGTEDTRRLATREEVKEKNWDLVSNLASARLVVTNRNDATGIETVEIVHEALIRSWERLQQWMQIDGEFRRWQEQLRSARRQWEQGGKQEGDLLRGKQLTEAEDWLQRRFEELTDSERLLIESSLQQRQRQFQKEKRRVLVLRSLLVLVSGAFVVAAGVGLFAFNQSRKAQKQNAINKATLVRSILPTKPLEALVQAIEATGSSQSSLGKVPPEVESSLLEAIHIAREGIIESNILRGHKSPVSSVAISPDGQMIVSASFDNTLRLWDLQGNQIGEPFSGHEDVVNSVAFSPDGKYIVSGSLDHTLRLWDLKGNQTGEPFQGHGDVVYAVAFSPDGKYIASAGFDNNLRLWDLEGNQIGEPFRGHEDVVLSVTFSPDSQNLASSSDDNTVRLWDLDGNQIGKPFRGHKNWVNSVAFSPDGKYIVSGSYDNTLHLWDLEGNQIGEPFRGHEDVVYSVTFSPDGKYIVSGSYDNTIRLWDVEGKPIGKPFRGHKGVVNSVTFNPQGAIIVSGSGDKTVRLWDLEAKSTEQIFQGHESVVHSVAFSPDDGETIVSAAGDKTIRLWNRQGNLLGEPLEGHDDSINSVAFSPDGNYIVSGSSDKDLRLWDLEGNQIGEAFSGHETAVLAVAFSPDGQTIVSGAGDNTVRLWDLEGKPIGKPFEEHQDVVLTVAFSPDGKTIASGGYDTTVRLWDLEGKPIGKPFRGHQGFVRSVAFSPDGKYIVSSSDDMTVRLWDLEGNPMGEPFQGHEGFVSSVAFSPDGEYIVSGSGDKTVRLWDLEGQQVSEPFRGHEKPISSVAFSPDGRYIASGSDDQTVRLWDREGNWQNWLQVACKRLRHHSILNNPQTQEATGAGKTCRKLVWSQD
ncbi:MAG: CHAT domain-containing protein [Symploca sp. SIO3C6]|nr:CHAT domain-containing protein [Symploca sp. SIO3C6]